MTHTYPNPIAFSKVGKIFTETNPDIKNADWVIPIDNVLIAMGNISLVKMCNTGSIPAPLMTFITTMAARGIQLKVLNEALLMGMIFGFLPRGEGGSKKMMSLHKPI